MGDNWKSNQIHTEAEMLAGRGKKTELDKYMSKTKKKEIYNSVKIFKKDKDTVQIFKIQVDSDTWYAMKDYECKSGELKKIPKSLLDSLGSNLHTKSFDLANDRVSDMEVLKRMQLSAVSSV